MYPSTGYVLFDVILFIFLIVVLYLIARAIIAKL